MCFIYTALISRVKCKQTVKAGHVWCHRLMSLNKTGNISVGWTIYHTEQMKVISFQLHKLYYIVWIESRYYLISEV